jgi:hypothetical protein
MDLVVGDEAGEVAVECDGDRFHDLDRIPGDMVRQAVLERAGWRFVRVRGTRFWRDPVGTTEWAMAELARLGVKPSGRAAHENAAHQSAPHESALHEIASHEPAPGSQPIDLSQRVVRRAHEIMKEMRWGGR